MSINAKGYARELFYKISYNLSSLKKIDKRITPTKDKIKSAKLALKLANRESDLLTLQHTMHSKALFDFDMTLSTVIRLIEVKSRYSQVQESKDEITLILLDGLLRQISPNVILLTYEEYLQFFESFLAEYNKLNGTNK